MPDSEIINAEAIYLLNHAYWAYKGALDLAQTTNNSRHWSTAKTCLQIYRERLIAIRATNLIYLAQLRQRRSRVRANAETELGLILPLEKEPTL